MNNRPLFFRAIRNGDTQAAAKHWLVLSDDESFPGLDGYVEQAIQTKQPKSLKWLIDNGAQCKGLRDSLDLTGKVNFAVRRESWECFDILLECEADVNFLSNGERRCFALEQACRQGRLDIVKQLVKYGGWIDYPGPMRNAEGHPAVQEFLRSAGAAEVEPHPPASESNDWLADHLTACVGTPKPNELHQIVGNDVPVSIVVVPTDEALVLVTRGMSSVIVPNDEGENSAAELVIQLPAVWANDVEDLSPPLVWAIGCLQSLASIPADAGVALPFFVITPDGSMPPLVSGESVFSNILILNAMDELPPGFDGEQKVDFHYLIPLFQDEAHLGAQKGIVELMSRFESQGIGRIFDPNRPNVAGLE